MRFTRSSIELLVGLPDGGHGDELADVNSS